MRTYPDRQESFAVGEISKSLHRKFSADFYPHGARSLANWFVSKNGTLLTRSGTQNVAATKNAAKKARLFPFKFSDDQAYMLEVGDQYLRIRGADGSTAGIQVPEIFIQGPSNGGICYRSGDGGQSWVSAGVTSGGDAPPAVNGPTIVAANPYSSGINYSLDGGITWATKSIPTASWRAVCWTGSYWLAVGDSGAIAYCLSSDPSSTWYTDVKGTANWIGVASYGGGKVMAVGTTGTRLVSGSAVYMYSSNHGVSWGAQTGISTYSAYIGLTSIVADAATASFTVCTGANDTSMQLVRTTNNGGSWTSIMANVVDWTMKAGPYLYAMASTYASMYPARQGLYRSTDGGVTWGLVAGGEATGVIKIGNTLYASLTVGAVLTKSIKISKDDGVTWYTRTVADPKNFKLAAGAMATAYEAGFPYLEADLPKLRKTQVGDVAEFTCLGKPRTNVIRYGTGFYVESADEAAPGEVVTGLAFTGTPNQTGDADHPVKEWAWVVTWQADGGRESKPCAALVPAGSGKVALYPDRPVTIQWNRVGGAARYHIYRGRNGRYGYVGTKESTASATETFYDDGSIPVISQDPPAWEDPFTANKPAVSVIFQNRKVYANNATDPSKVWFSATGAYYDFDESFVKNADDAFFRTLATESFEEIRGLLWLGQLMAFTSEAVWSINGAQGAPVAFDSIEANPEVYSGCAWVAPIALDKQALFVQALGNQIRNLYRDANGWASQDLSELAQHLFDGRTVVSWAYARRPYGVFWIVLDDGALLSLTYKEGSWAWAHHNTYGGTDKFEDVAVIPKDGRDQPWFIVQRGAARYIEKMPPRNALFTSADACAVDAAVYYSGVATATVTGLAHLNGRSVYGLGDGKVYGPVTVTAGSATFPATAAKWWVGLLITYDFESLDYSKAWTEQKTIQSVVVETSAEDLPVDPAASIQIGVDLTHLSAVPFSQLRQGLIEEIAQTHMDPGGRVAVRLAAPIPLEIKGITRNIAIGK